jgi:hypothetical protein
LRSDHLLYQVEGFLLVLSVATYGLWLLVKRLRRGRADLQIGAAIAVAMLVRLAAAGALSLLPNSRAFRGPDELVFLENAQEISDSSLGSILTGHGITSLHEWLFALQERLFEASDLTLRLTQISLAVAGLAFLATAVYDLAGPRPARLAIWLMAFEPTNVFYSGYLHKEPLITFAMGVTAYGAVLMWRRRSVGALAVMGAGCVVATLSRPYVGWFLTGAAIAVTLHAALRTQHELGENRRAGLLAAAIVALVFVAAPLALREAPAQLERLQASQEANANDASNLKYERVDYSTPAAIVANLPGRVSAFLFRPYPWQLQNTNQQIGALGGVIVLLTLFALAVALARNRAGLIPRAGPLLYIAGALIVAYSVTAANAGTAFRLRENVTALLICLVCLLRARPLGRRASSWAGLAPARPSESYS